MHEFYEMAKPKRSIETMLSNHTRSIVEHLLKLFYFRDTQWQNKWLKDLNTSTPDVPLFSHNKNLPDKKFILQNLWLWTADTYERTVYRKVIDIIKNYTKLSCANILKKPDIDKTKKFCNEYFDWASDELSNSGVITLDDIKGIIPKLLMKYKYN